MPAIVLFEPQIPPNTGNIIRLAANCGFDLHLIQPLGFSLDAHAVRRAGMDYQELASVTVHPSLDACLELLCAMRLVLVSTKGTRSYHQFTFSHNDILLFGNEGSGLSHEVWQNHAHAPCIRIPMRASNRSINLANAVAIVAYACWQQLDFYGADLSPLR